MVQFEIKKNILNKSEFSYDLRALAQSFFPEKECNIVEKKEWSGEEGYPLICTVEDDVILQTVLDKGYTKDTVKATVYKAFAEKTNKTLLWGILTGIRPAKIPLRMLMDGQDSDWIKKTLCDKYLLQPEKATLAYDVAKREYELTHEFEHENGYNLYIGIPFCPSICRYCSFSSYDYRTFSDKVDEYLSALEKEIIYTASLARKKGKRLHTIYVGGGTPTSLSTQQLQRLMDMIHQHLPVQETAEFTVEAGRPDSITEEKLWIMKKAKVTRISVNPQTMKQHTLDLLGRKHTVEEVEDIFMLARKLGFTNINMDLIIGLPEEKEEDFVNTLNRLVQLEPDSITVHTLVIKRASRMRREQLDNGEGMLEEDRLIPVLQQTSESFLRAYGYQPYYMYRQKNKAHTTRNVNQENVAYAKRGKECLYNIFIMEELETIIALGSGGSTKYVIPDENRMERIENVKSVDDYIERIDEMIERKKVLWH